MINWFVSYGNQTACYGGSPTTAAICYPSSYPTNVRSMLKTTQARKRPANLLANMTAFTTREVETRHTPVPLDYGNQTAIQSYGSAPAWGINSQELDSMMREAQGKLNASVRDVKWNAATTIAEFGETLRFMTDASRRLLDYYKLARKGDIWRLSELYRARDARGRYRKDKWWKRALDEYLAFRYAVRPLVNDLDSVLAEIANSNAKPVVRRAVGRSTMAVSRFEEGSVNGESWVRTSNGTCHVRKTCYIAIDPRVANWKRLGFLNLPSVLWEVTPFSFMFDWILPVGNYLAQLDTDVGVTILGGSTATKQEDFVTRFGLVRRAGSSVTTVNDYSRSIGVTLSAVPPRITPSLDALKLLDVLAILQQIRDGSPGPVGFRR